jgi:hypothetical protein
VGCTGGRQDGPGWHSGKSPLEWRLERTVPEIGIQRQFTGGFTVGFHRQHGASAAVRRRFRPELERLEGRNLPSISYHGGPVLPNVEVEAVFLGSDWNSPALSFQVAEVSGFLNFITNSSYMDMLTRAGYGVGRGGFSGAMIDPLPLSGVVSDDTIRAELQRLVNAGSIPPPDGNRLYFVYVEPGVLVTAGGQNSATDFLAYHDSFPATSGIPINYAVVPHPDGPTGLFYATPFQQQSEVSSHELAEGVTDPQGTAWFKNNRNQDEIGDLVAGQDVYLNGFLVQLEVNKHEQPIRPPGSTRHPSGFLWL